MYRLESITNREEEALVAFMCGDEWPFHLFTAPTPELVRGWVAQGIYDGEDAKSFWLMRGDDRVGFTRLYELTDPTPMIDVRVASAHRGRGAGTELVRLITAHAFRTYEHVLRIEAQTRQDNVAMRRTLVRCSYVKEAHYRAAWPVPGGAAVASIGYGILRQDWETGTVTPVRWNDEP